MDPTTTKLLAAPISPLNRTVFAESSIKQLQEWDLPLRVTAWKDRPSPQDLARQWDELDRKYSTGSQNKDKSKSNTLRGQAAPYTATPLPAKELRELEKWLEKNVGKKLSGACLDSGNAAYILAVGMIGGGAGVAPSDPNHAYAYNDYATKAQPSSLGPNAGTVPPRQTPHNELEVAGMANGAAGYTCAYLYRGNGKGMGQGGAQKGFPEYYYCHLGTGISESTVATMLKFLDKNGLAEPKQP